MMSAEVRPAHPDTGTACSSGPGGSWNLGQRRTGHTSTRGGTGADTRSPGQEVIRSSHYQMSPASPCTHRLRSRRSLGPRPGGYNRTWRADTCTSRTLGGDIKEIRSGAVAGLAHLVSPGHVVTSSSSSQSQPGSYTGHPELVRSSGGLATHT